MAYDPCGTQRLEGDEIIKRLAQHLGVDAKDLTKALLKLTQKYEVERKLYGEE